MSIRPSRRAPIQYSRMQGVSLIELMIAITIGLFIMAGMASIFASSAQSHAELEKASRQIENGRFGAESIAEDIQLAGFYGDYLPANTFTPSIPDPCTTTLNDMGFNAGTTTVPTGIFGLESGASTTRCTSALSNRKAGTDAIVIRRVSTERVIIDSNEDGTIDGTLVNGGYYFQASDCMDTPVEPIFVLGKTPSAFVLHTAKPVGSPATCRNGGLNAVRAYLTRIFYVASCNNCSGAGDGIPTLKMAELIAGTASCASDNAVACGSIRVIPIAEGIENMQIEYLQDTTNDGIPDAYVTASTLSATADPKLAWAQVVGAKIFLLARNTETSQGYEDNKVYVLSSDGNTTTGEPTRDAYKRHVFSIVARANNIAGRKQQ